MSHERRDVAAVLLAIALFSASIGCGFIDADTSPTIVAHRSGAGAWPENSRTAVQGALGRGLPGIEVDVALTSDDVPVLAHDFWLSEELCTRADGSPIGERVLVHEHTLAQLQSGYLCGGERDPETPDAEVVADVIMTLDELLGELAGSPQTTLYLDVKFDPDVTPPAPRFAAAIMGRWRAAALPNRLWVESTFPRGIRAFAAEGDVVTAFGWPYFPPGESSTAIGLGNELLGSLGLRDPIDLAEDAGADGISVPYQLVDRRSLEEARARGLITLVWTVNDAGALGTYCGWPIDGLLSDYPERAPCL